MTTACRRKGTFLLWGLEEICSVYQKKKKKDLQQNKKLLTDNWDAMNHHSETEKGRNLRMSLRFLKTHKLLHISGPNASPAIFLPASFSPSRPYDGLTQGYKWHKFLSIIPLQFPSLLVPPPSVLWKSKTAEPGGKEIPSIFACR